MRIAVVGAGIVGASAARFASERGHEVVLFEQHEPASTVGSSHGRSRIVRKAYPDAFYTGIMVEAYPMWRALEEASGERLLDECGLLYFGKGDHPELEAQIAALQSLGVRHTVLDAKDASPLIEGLRLDPDEVGVLTPEAGWVDAARAVLASVRLAQAAGAELRIQRFTPNDAAGFDAVAFCAGPWIRRFVGLDVRTTRQSVAYLEGRHSGPVWIEESETHPYGFPSEPGRTTFKMALHHPGPEIDPDDSERTADPVQLEQIREAAWRRFGLAEPIVAESLACVYTTTPDEDFRVGRLPDGSVYASPCSGHGFKFGPWIGRLLVEMLEGRRDAPERFVSTTT